MVSARKSARRRSGSIVVRLIAREEENGETVGEEEGRPSTHNGCSKAQGVHRRAERTEDKEMREGKEERRSDRVPKAQRGTLMNCKQCEIDGRTGSVLSVRASGQRSVYPDTHAVAWQLGWTSKARMERALGGNVTVVLSCDYSADNAKASIRSRHHVEHHPCLRAHPPPLRRTSRPDQTHRAGDCAYIPVISHFFSSGLRLLHAPTFRLAWV